MAINKYKDYLFEGIDVKESKMMFSDNLTKLLTGIGDNISKDLLSLLTNDKVYQYSFIDLSKEEPDKITILPLNKLSRIEGASHNDLEWPTSDSPVWGPYGRQPVRVGAFVTKLFPKYGGSKDLENFVHAFTAKGDAKNYTIKLVKGEELRKWYLVDHYYNPTPWAVDKPEGDETDIRTVLMKSCLKQPEKQPFFDMYVYNPDKVQMLIMLNGNNKLVARALIWIDVYVLDDPKNPSKKTFMDRIYYTQESDVAIFKDYATKNGWLYKTVQSKDCIEFVMDGKVCNFVLLTRLTKTGMFNKYPYLDTMMYYTPDSGRLATTRGKPAVHPKTGEIMERYELRKANGGWKRLSKSQ